ncbi:MAG: TSUP family transporter [Planctomycetota bacterium]
MTDPLTMTTLLWLSGAAGLAGFIDAIAGGGGLLTLPALLLAGLPPTAALATNKGQSVWGSAAALIRFSRSNLLDRQRLPHAFFWGLVGAVAGTLLLQAIPAQALRPVVVVLLFVAAIAVLVIRIPDETAARSRGAFLTGLVAGGIGAYDGFFGPGTGTFLILAFVLLWHEPFHVASANAKVVNCASNVGSLSVFAILGQVWWLPAICMGLAQIIGGWLGAHVVVRSGQRYVRGLAVVMSLAIVARLAWQMMND